MIGSRSVLVGGAAAAIVASALYLFPPLTQSGPTTRLSGKQFTDAKNTFATALEGQQSAIASLDQFGLIASAVKGADNAILLSEEAGDCAGRGVYWIGKNAGNALAITAPHRGSDRYTGTLAAALFLETDALAAAWNSSPRRANTACENAIDLARTKDHLFSAFTLGFAQSYPNGLIVQLHGFDGAKRESLAAQDAAMILSNGTNRPSARLLDLADELSLAFAPRQVLVFPIGTAELGATTNAQGQLLQEAGFDGFVHIEISTELRAALMENAGLRTKLADALVRAAR